MFSNHNYKREKSNEPNANTKNFRKWGVAGDWNASPTGLGNGVRGQCNAPVRQVGCSFCFSLAQGLNPGLGRSSNLRRTMML